MTTMIEKLKDKKKVQAFGLMSVEEQACFKKVGYKNLLQYIARTEWAKVFVEQIYDNVTYAIKPDYKPDYQPEPEFVNLEIVKGFIGGYLGVSMNEKAPFLPLAFTLLHCLPDLPGFERFRLHRNPGEMDISVQFDDVALHIYQGKRVYAKFRSK